MKLSIEARDETKERIHFNTEIVKLFGLLSIATATGIFSLILTGINNTRQFVISLIGSIVLMLLIGIAIFVYIQTIKLLKQLRDV